MVDYEIFELGDVRLSRGETLRDAKLAYKTYRTVMLGLDPSIHGRFGTARSLGLLSLPRTSMDPRVKPEGDISSIGSALKGPSRCS